jgi:hypothetical protein
MARLPTGYFEGAFHHTLTGSLHDNVTTMGFHYSGLDLAADFPVLRDAWIHINEVMADVWHYQSFTMSNADGIAYESIGPFSQGTEAHTACTGNIAFLLKKVTAIGGRKGRGRSYVPGVSEQDVDPLGVVSSSKLTELQGALDAFNQAKDVGHWSLVLLHSIGKGQDPAIDGMDPTPLTDIKWSSQVATQRKRMPRL